MSRKKQREARRLSQEQQARSWEGAQTVQSLSSGTSARLDDRGQIVPFSSDSYRHWQRRERRIGNGTDRFYADSDSAKELNNYLGETGYSLTGGDGRVVVGHRTVNTPRGIRGSSKGRKETLAIYGPAARSQPDSTSGGTQPANSGPAPEAVQRTRRYAEDRIYGRVPEGRKPQMFPQGVQVEGRASEAVANYADRLDTYNQNLHGWMNNRAVASRYESGRFLQNLAAGIPQAPDIMSSDELFNTAQRFSGIEYD